MLWATLLGASALLAQSRPQGAVARRTVGYGETTLEELGLTEDVTLRLSGSRTAAVQIELPSNASQGQRMWYALRIVSRWEGVPSARVDVSFDAKWNGAPAYSILLRQPAWPTRLSEDWAEFQIVDLVNGGSRELAKGGRFGIRSTNYPTFSSVRPGTNVLSLELSSLGESVGDVSVVVSRSSSVLASNVGPAHLAFEGHAEIDGTRMHVDVSGRNSGISTPPVRFVVVAHYPDGTRRGGLTDPIGSVEARASFRANVAYTLPQSEPLAVQLVADWDAGQSRAVLVYPANRHSPSFFRRPLALALGLVAFVVAWVAFPAAVVAFRRPASR